MTAARKSLFMFLMNLAWKCRYSMPLLLSGAAALLGQAWMFQLRVQTAQTIPDHELRYFGEEDFEEEEEEDDDDEEDDPTWETESTDSWETIIEEVAYG